MKRSKALLPLSRDHHRALSVALMMKRADDASVAAADFARFWEENGKAHFRVEEEVLLPIWAHLGNVDDAAATRLAREHLEIRAAALALHDGPGLDQVRALGEKLTAHVRFEERELFGLIEADLDLRDQEELARAVTEAEREAA